jgi:hypothetical protein
MDDVPWKLPQLFYFSSGLRGHKRTYLTILESADHALFKMVRYCPIFFSKESNFGEKFLFHTFSIPANFYRYLESRIPVFRYRYIPDWKQLETIAPFM